MSSRILCPVAFFAAVFPDSWEIYYLLAFVQRRASQTHAQLVLSRLAILQTLLI